MEQAHPDERHIFLCVHCPPAIIQRMPSSTGLQRIARSATLVMLGMVLSNLIGLVRTTLVASAFGTGPALDSFWAANRVPELIFNLVAGGALASAFLPTYTDFLVRKDRAGADRLVSAIATWLFVCLSASSLLCALWAEPILQWLIVPGFSADQVHATAGLLRILLLSPALFGISGLLMGVLNAHQRFFFSALAPMFYPLGQIFGAVVLAPTMGVAGLAWGAVLGACLHLTVQLPAWFALRSRFRPTWGAGQPAVGQVMRLMTPRLIGQSAVQLNFTVNTILASTQPFGSITALQLAWSLMMMPEIAIAQAAAVAALPSFSAQASRGELDALRTSMVSLLRGVFFLALPASVGLIFLGEPLVRLIFERGQFNARSTEMVTWALYFYAAGLFSHSLLEVLTRGYYALKDTLTPVIYSTLGVALAIVLSIVFSYAFTSLGWMPLGGLALGTTLASIMETSILAVLLRRKMGGWLDRPAWASFLRTILASILMAAALMGWRSISGTFSPAVVALGGIAIGILAYGIASWVTGSPEAKSIMGVLGKALRRKNGIATY
jgi:putative peptidoglycan lipid II flippase